MIRKTYKDSFNACWLFESPINTGVASQNPFNDLMSAIKTNIDLGYSPTDLSNDLHKLNTGREIFYWIDNKIAAEFKQVPTGLYVELIGKKEGADVYASKFYEMILQDANQLIISGKMLSNQGLSIWKQLFNDGKKIFVYNIENAFDRKSIDTVDDFEKYLGSAIDFEKYRFVLSESVKEHGSALTSFDLLRTYYLTFNLEGFK